jgi:hypothetical protein
LLFAAHPHRCIANDVVFVNKPLCCVPLLLALERLEHLLRSSRRLQLYSFVTFFILLQLFFSHLPRNISQLHLHSHHNIQPHLHSQHNIQPPSHSQHNIQPHSHSQHNTQPRYAAYWNAKSAAEGRLEGVPTATPVRKVGSAGSGVKNPRGPITPKRMANGQ